MKETIRCLFVLLLITASHAALAADPKADWIGTLEVNASTKLRLAVHIKASENDRLEGTLDNIDQGIYGVALTEIASTPQTLSFVVPEFTGRYEGKWDEAQQAWVGQWQQRNTLPLVLKAAPPVPKVTPGDRLEPGKQGETMPGEEQLLPQPYSKGVRLVGHTALPNGAGSIMAWAGHCAYAPGRSGVSVIDVQNPRAPKVVGLLKDKGAVGAGETIHAASGVLAAAVYGQAGPYSRAPTKDDGWLAVYDVSNCANPKLMVEFKWPERVHTVTVSPNGKRIYGTVISAFTGDGGIFALDIADPAQPRFLGRFGATRPDGTTFEFATHEVSISPNEQRIYAGVISSRGDDLNQGVSINPPNALGLGPDAGGIYILDNSDIASGRPDPKMRLIGTAQHAGWHSAVQANIKGVSYLVGAGELLACPGSWPRITNIADERNPRRVGEFRLAMNFRENCPEPIPPETTTGGVVGRPGTAASHWNDVDNATDTRLGLFPFTWAGLRIVDLRNPANPVEVAYFKPGASCMSHVRYVRETGHIWLTCQSGFYAIELLPQLRESLGLPR